MDSRYDAAAYEHDFYAWTRQQAAALRAQATVDSNAPIDWENVADEIASMGNSQRDKIESHLEVLLIHLLKWLYCPTLRERCQRGWRNTIAEQRRRIARVVKKNPSLKHASGELLEDIYEDARALAAGEADAPLKTFPKIPPFTIDQVLDPHYPSELFPVEDDD